MIDALLAGGAVIFLAWMAFRGGQLLDAVAGMFGLGRVVTGEPEPHEQLLDDPQ